MPRKRKWSEKDLQIAVKNSSSYRQVIHKLHLIPAGGNYSQIKKYIKEYKINIKHFKGKAWNKGMTGLKTKKTPLEKILTKNNNYQSYKLKNRLFEENLKKKKCEKCGWAKLSKDGRLPLELDHINGDRRDNRIENLRILCPNCHSLEPTHRGMNRGKIFK
ncbi:hypothetical protein GW764_00030 [Candidatus Parcubacteria bacterium]|nr:hypothetical protein [Candidatus Parcubacteria bacterium]